MLLARSALGCPSADGLALRSRTHQTPSSGACGAYRRWVAAPRQTSANLFALFRRKRLACFWLALGCVCVARPASAQPPEVLDRVVISFGNVAITQSDAEREYHFELFLNGKMPTGIPDPAALQQIYERLINQRLLARELETVSGAAESSRSAALVRLAEVQKQFANPEAFETALGSLGMDKQQVLDRLVEQERVLRMIDQRLRPAAAPATSDIETYYRETFLPECARKKAEPAPALAEAESQIREILVQRRIDQLLDQWLEELQATQGVRLHAF